MTKDERRLPGLCGGDDADGGDGGGGGTINLIDFSGSRVVFVRRNTG